MTKDEALRMALEALHGFIPYLPLDDEAQCGRYDQAITAIKETLAQPEKDIPKIGCVNHDCDKCKAQPDMWESILGAVARGWCYEENANKTMDSDLAVAIAKEVQALYTTPPQRTAAVGEDTRRAWVGLTDEEIESLYEKNESVNWARSFARAIEAKLKEKNND